MLKVLTFKSLFYLSRYFYDIFHCVSFKIQHSACRAMVHRRLANGIPLQKHLHLNLGKTHTPYLRLRSKSHPKIPRILRKQSPIRPQINLFPLCIRALKEKR